MTATSDPRNGAASYLEELVLTILLGLSALASAYGVWQGQLWRGVQSRSYVEAGRLGTASSRETTVAMTQMSYDAATTVELLLAYVDHPERIPKLRDHVIRDEFAPYVDEWIATKPLQNAGAPSTPFELDSFHNAKMLVAHANIEMSKQFITAGHHANLIADRFIFTTVATTFALFFAGLAPKLRRRSLRATVIVLGVAALVITLAQLAVLPRA